VHQVKVAMTNASLFAYVADGEAGLRVLQLTDPETMPTYAGFSPRPQPRLISTFQTKGPAVAVSKGLDRDRAVDESGNQTAVFGRRGARPFTLEEMRRMYLTKDGRVFTVSNIRGLDDKTPLPRVQNALAPDEPPAAVDAGKSAAVSDTFAAPAGLSKTQTVVVGLGLFFALIGWHRFIKMRNDE
jgi:hypothetical protein